MKTATSELIALLNEGVRVDFVDLYTITLLGGQRLWYTGGDRAITWGLFTFQLGPLFTRDRIKTKIGVSVDTLQVTLNTRDTDLINGVPMLAFIAAGGLDGGRMRCERLYRRDWDTPPAGSLLAFEGRIGDTDTGRFESKITVVSDLELLDVMLPRNVYQPGCMNTLYDQACGVSRSGKTVVSSVTSAVAPTKWQFTAGASVPGFSTGYFSLGVAGFTSGPNAGVRRTIRAFTGGSGLVELISPLPFAPGVGDAFTIYPGCDKMQATCQNKFANIARFRGTPYIPTPETIT